MTRQTSDHFLATENNKRQEKAMNIADAFSPGLAADYARKMVEMETRGNGDHLNALERTGRRIGVSSRSLRRLINGETKDPGIALFGRIWGAYHDYCMKQIQHLQHELEIGKSRFGDAHFEDLDGKIQALAEEVKAATQGR